SPVADVTVTVFSPGAVVGGSSSVASKVPSCSIWAEPKESSDPGSQKLMSSPGVNPEPVTVKGVMTCTGCGGPVIVGAFGSGCVVVGGSGAGAGGAGAGGAGGAGAGAGRVGRAGGGCGAGSGSGSGSAA